MSAIYVDDFWHYYIKTVTYNRISCVSNTHAQAEGKGHFV